MATSTEMHGFISNLVNSDSPSHLTSLRALTYFGVLFFDEFLIGPGAVKGEGNVGEVLFMLFLKAGLSVVFFNRSAMGLDKS